jgi:hypothetical protein
VILNRLNGYQLFTGNFMAVQGWKTVKTECTGTSPGKKESFNSLFLGS